MEIHELLQQLGGLSYLGVFGIALISNVFVPVPEEIVLMGFGYVLTGSSTVHVVPVIAIIILGLLISDIALYFFARAGARPLMWFYNKFFAKRLEAKKDWLHRHVGLVIFSARFMVQLRFLGPFISGQLKVPFKRFVLLDLAALMIYVPLFVFIGHYFRRRIESVIAGVHQVQHIILVIIALGILFSVFKYLGRFLFKKIGWGE